MHAKLKINVIYFKSKEEGVKKDGSKKKKKETRNVFSVTNTKGFISIYSIKAYGSAI